jgi:hypothetical protein
MSQGITFVLGCPGSGKTTLAYKIVRERAAADGKPILAIDPQRVAQLADLPHAESVREACNALWGAGRHVAYTPEGEEDFDALFRAVRAGKNVHVLVDEARFFMSGRTVPPGFNLFARVYRHAFCDVVCTSQSYQDAGRPVKAVVGEWRVGRMTSPADLEALRVDWNLDPAEIA